MAKAGIAHSDFMIRSFFIKTYRILLPYLSEPKENMKLVLTEITSRSGMSAVKRMGYVNNFTKVS